MEDKTTKEDLNDDGYIKTSSPRAGKFLEPSANKSEGKVDGESRE